VPLNKIPTAEIALWTMSIVIETAVTERRKVHVLEVDAYWRAANYARQTILSVGQIYLLDNSLLREHACGNSQCSWSGGGPTPHACRGSGARLFATTPA